MQRSIRTALAAAAVAAVTGTLLSVSAGTAAAEPSGLAGDFNGDGFKDIAASAPNATVSGLKGAGQVVILYGSATGLDAGRRQVVSQNSAGVQGAAEAGDGFGTESAAGDFNHDGFADLAVAAPSEKLGTDTSAGLVQILWGSTNGIASGSSLADPEPGNHDFWGKALAAGDFDGDGTDELATGDSSNKLRVFRGIAPNGTTAGVQTVPVNVFKGDAYHGIQHLTSGDVTNDGKADLVVNGLDSQALDGWFLNTNYFLAGTDTGISASAKRTPAGIITAIGDVNADGFGDMVTGLHFDPGDGAEVANVPGSVKGGKVTVIYGSATGPTGTVTNITQDTGAVPGGSENGDAFGWEVSLGDINGDGIQDLAIGAPYEDLRSSAGAISLKDTGSVTVIYGSAGGLDTAHTQFIEQETPGVPGGNESGDRFGMEVFLSDVDGDNDADLAIGSGEDNSDGAVIAVRSDGTRLGNAAAVGAIRMFQPAHLGVSKDGYPYLGAVIGG